MKQGFLGTIGWIKGNLMSNPDLKEKGYSNETFYPGSPDIPNSAIESLAKVLPTDVAGLCLCLDSEINSRQGIHDESINGMQNLVYAPIVSNANTTGCLEKLNGTATFSDKGVKLGGVTYIPCYETKSLTFEFVGEFDVNVFDNVIGQQVLLNSTNKGGYNITCTANTIQYHAFNSSNKYIKKIVYGTQIEPNKKYHIAITDVIGSVGTTKIYIDGKQVVPTADIDTTGGVPASDTNIGVMGVHNSSNTNSIFPVTTNGQGAFYGEYTYINAMRLWNRVLSPEEIQANYQADKRRFG